MRGAVSRAEKQEILIRSIASVAKPLLFSLLIILASFLPVFFLEEREARLFDPLAYSKTFAMAFSTLLTMLAAAADRAVDLQARHGRAHGFPGERAPSGRTGRRCEA